MAMQMHGKKKKFKQQKTNSLIYKYKICPEVPSIHAMAILRSHGPCLEEIRGRVSVGQVCSL